MRRSYYRFLGAIVLAVCFLLYASIGYGAYSDSLVVRGRISGYVPAAVPMDESKLIPTDAPDMPSGETQPPSPAPDDRQPAVLPEVTASPAPEIFAPETDMSRKIYIHDGSAAGKAAPFFSGAYTDRSGNHVQKDKQPANYWEKNTLVVYADIAIPQNGTPDAAILAEMSVDMGAAIRLRNTSSADLILARTSASAGMAQSFVNEDDSTRDEGSIRLAPGQSGVISAYLDHGWQLKGSELDLENLPGMLCTREFEMSFQAKNTQTGECRVYSILLVASINTQAPEATPLPTVEILPTPSTAAPAIPEPTPTPEVTTAPEGDPTPEPTSTVGIEPTVAPEDTPALTPEPEPMPTFKATPEPEPTPEPVPEPTREPVPEPTPEAAPTFEATLVPEPMPEPTPEAVPTFEATLVPEPTPEITSEPNAEQVPVATVAVETVPAVEPPSIPIPDPTEESQQDTQMSDSQPPGQGL